MNSEAEMWRSGKGKVQRAESKEFGRLNISDPIA